MDGMDRANKVERAEVRVAWSKTIAAGKIVQYFALAKSAIYCNYAIPW